MDISHHRNLTIGGNSMKNFRINLKVCVRVEDLNLNKEIDQLFLSSILSFLNLNLSLK